MPCLQGWRIFAGGSVGCNRFRQWVVPGSGSRWLFRRLWGCPDSRTGGRRGGEIAVVWVNWGGG